MVGTGSSEVFKKATMYREGSEAAVPYQPAIQHNGVLPCSLGDALSTLEARTVAPEEVSRKCLEVVTSMMQVDMTLKARSFASYLASHLAFVVWLLWVFTPDERLQSWGITYYPDRWWGVALPVYVIPLAIFVFLTYNALNMLSACPLDSVNMYRDASTPLTDELFATAGDIPDLQDVSLSTVNRNTVLQRCGSIQAN
ncbi:PIGP [Symbiodinium necroappetens]|uniref:PIGP protein n=1 Tax=Symbiodinium necroappetens TaxID=1628268 RepID=A0A813BRP5_9DINO|nr:PIGP [Symbiodinium necroappetens]